MSTREKTHWVHDYETLANCFMGVFEDYKTENTKVFIVHSLRNDLVELIHFLEENKALKEWHISFNGLAFDSQITEYILREKDELLPLSGEQVAELIYAKAQEIINRQDTGDFQEFNESNLSIQQVDVFKLNHWDNPAKRSSLKWIQYSMDWDNIQEMPIHHGTQIKTIEQLNMIEGYCINDVRSTKRIMQLSKEQINLRATLSAEYKLKLYSASEPRISKELFMLFLSAKTGIKRYELRQLRTNRKNITVKDIILPYTKFSTPIFQDLLDNFKHVVIDTNSTKGGFKYSIKYKGVKTDFGLGGVHGARESGIYTEGNGMIIMSSDVVSYYPNLAIRNGWAPAHLPAKEFCELYEWFFEERKKIPKKDPKNYVYKIILNSTFGLSIDKNSFLYDPQFGMQITINGQLSLMMLYEMLVENIPECKPLMQNTDGLEMMIPEQYKDKYLEICAEWEKMTRLQLEHDTYSKIILADVNNYIAVNTAGKYKCKGRFEFENLALHKNKSYLIIPKAVFNYLVNDIAPEKYLSENRNILDYCAGVKIKGDWEFQQNCIEYNMPEEYVKMSTIDRQKYVLRNGWVRSWGEDNWVNSKSDNQEANTGIRLNDLFAHLVKKESTLSVKKTVLQKTIRYYISEGGCNIMKVNKSDGREISLEAGKWLQKDLSKFEQKEWAEYNVDESYYLQKIYKELHTICPPEVKQLKLF